MKIGWYKEDFFSDYGHDDSYFERIWTFRKGKITVIDESFILDDGELVTQNRLAKGMDLFLVDIE